MPFFRLERFWFNNISQKIDPWNNTILPGEEYSRESVHLNNTVLQTNPILGRHWGSELPREEYSSESVHLNKIVLQIPPVLGRQWGSELPREEYSSESVHLNKIVLQIPPVLGRHVGEWTCLEKNTLVRVSI
jgi:hypothetical protein